MTIEELQEFVLHFAVYAGWPKASLVSQIIREIVAERNDESGD